MDNKQNRQFYWEVKQFINKDNFQNTQNNSKKSIKDSVSSILNENKAYKKTNFVQNIESKDTIISYVASLIQQEKKYIPECKAFTANKTLNPFSLLEYTGRGGAMDAGRDSGTIGRTDTENTQNRMLDRRARNAAENERLAQAKADVKRKREEDEALKYREEVGELEMGRDGNKNLPADTPENRKKMAEWRREKADTKQVDYMASRIAELSGKKPEELTAKEAGELSLMKSMTQGEVATKGLEGKIQRKLEVNAKVSPLALEPTAGTDNTGRTQEQIDMDAMAAGKPSADDAVKRKEVAKGQLSRTLGKSQEELVGLTQTAVGREAEQKQAADAQYRQEMQARRLKERENQRIQGTKMTYGQFKELSGGKEYDPLSSEDSSLAIKYASQDPSARYTPAAREAAQTTYRFNRDYSEKNAELAKKQGEADRRYDKAKMEYDESWERVEDPTEGSEGFRWTADVPKSFIKQWEESGGRADRGPLGDTPGRYPGIGKAWREEQERRRGKNAKSENPFVAEAVKYLKNSSNEDKKKQELERRERNRKRESSESLLSKGMKIATEQGINPTEQILSQGSSKQVVNIPVREVGQSINTNLSGFKMSRGFV